MDKPDFLHKLNGLRAFQTAGQGLRLARTLTGQKIRGVQVPWFRTFDPVDIHGLVHRGGCFQAAPAFSRLPDKGRGRDPDRAGGFTGAGKFFSSARRSADLGKEAKLDRLVRSKPSRQPGASLAEVENFFSAGSVNSKRVLRFTTKSLFTE